MTKKSIGGMASLTGPSCHHVCRGLVLAVAALLLAFCSRQSRAGEGGQTSSQTNNSSSGHAGTTSPDSFGTWQTIRTKAADGITETTAILRVADVLKSDPRLAGLMLRCSKQGVEPVIVVVEPFSPQARPRITLRADQQEFYFEGKPLPTGAGLRIPADGFDLVNGPWKGARDLTIKISDGETEIDGVVELSGLTNAIQSLAGCPGK